MPYRLRLVFAFLPALWQLIVCHMPGEAGYQLRQLYWGKRLKHMGKGVRIRTGVTLENPQLISIGDNCMIMEHTALIAGTAGRNREIIKRDNPDFGGEPGEIALGRNVYVGIGVWMVGIDAGIRLADDCCVTAGCKLIAYTHHYRSAERPDDHAICFGGMVPGERHVMVSGPITFGENSGLAINSVVLPGVALGRDCFARMGSVLTASEYPDNSLIAGDPAKVVGKRFSDS